MRNYSYDHVHLRSSDPEATASFFETMFGAVATRGVYPPGTLYPGQKRISFVLGGQKILNRTVNEFPPTPCWNQNSVELGRLLQHDLRIHFADLHLVESLPSNVSDPFLAHEW